MDELLKIKDEALSQIEEVSTLKELNDLRVFYLGKKGPMQAAMKSMKDMSKDERASFGQVSNKVKQEITQSIEEKKEALEEAEMNAQLLEEDIVPSPLTATFEKALSSVIGAPYVVPSTFLQDTSVCL